MEFEFDELVYDTTEGGFVAVMVCVNLVSGILVTRNIQVDIRPKDFNAAIDSAVGEKNLGLLDQCMSIQTKLRLGY